MAGHSHDDHQVNEQKPVSFTVPFILAAVALLVIFLFLRICDPKPHGHGAHEGTEHGAAHHGIENPAHADFKGEVHNPNAAPNDHAPVAGQNNAQGANASEPEAGQGDSHAPAGEAHH
jgi:hypothetical protein